ncbi:olfactory receptor 2L3-like [Phascolarctos cinereus]|uniref:Olfactory receptor 2L3-like n=1 Tax=Phascolarctos cinereus TaxID=38626 RepID=A0A6P5LU68_PHACI|nr:olfactory receptor 2L3-like [Phascolarctos cinereus]
MEGWNQTTSGFFLLGLFPTTKIGLLLFLLVILIFLIGCLGNSTMILLIWMDHHLHTPMYFLLSQLSLMDLMYICSTVPKMAVNFLSGDNSISLVACGFQSFWFLLIAGGKGFLLASMAYDRYVAICHPLNYPILLNKRMCLLMISGSWLSSSINSICHTVYILSMPYCKSRIINHFFCDIPAMVPLACMDTWAYEYTVFFSTYLFLLVPFLGIMASYGRVLYAIQLMHSTQGRKKAFTTCSTHLTVVTFYCVPFMYTYLRPSSLRSPEEDKNLAVFYTILTPMFNPIIYSLRNKEVLGALQRVFRRYLFQKE